MVYIDQDDMSSYEWFNKLRKAYKDRDLSGFKELLDLSDLLNTSYRNSLYRYDTETIVSYFDEKGQCTETTVLKWILSEAAKTLPEDATDREIKLELQFIESVLEKRRNPKVPVGINGLNGLIYVEETQFQNVKLKCGCIELLIARGTDVNDSGRPSDYPPLFCARESAVVETLLKHGADPNLMAYSHKYADYGVSVIENFLNRLMPVPGMADRHADYAKLFDDAARTMELLLQYGAAPNADEAEPEKKLKRRSPLMELCRLKSEILIMKPTDKSGKDEWEDTADRYLPYLDKFLVRAFDLLVEAGADVNYEDLLGDTPSTVCSSSLLLKKLIDRGCSITRFNKAGTTLLGNIMEHKHGDLGDTVYSRYCHDGEEILDEYITRGGSVDCPIPFDITAMFAAVKSGDTKTIRKLAEAGADLNYHGRYNRTPLFYAFYTFCYYRDNSDVVKLMTELGADVTVTDERGDNLLHEWALNFGAVRPEYRNAYIDTMKLLIENGADVNALDGFRETPMRIILDNCSMRDLPELLPYLCEMVECGADPYKGDGKSAMGKIKYKKYRKVIEKYCEQKRTSDSAMEDDIDIYERT